VRAWICGKRGRRRQGVGSGRVKLSKGYQIEQGGGYHLLMKARAHASEPSKGREDAKMDEDEHWLAFLDLAIYRQNLVSLILSRCSGQNYNKG
jgi:hypothetical protein